MRCSWLSLLTLILVLGYAGRAAGQNTPYAPYDIGSPVLTTLYVSPSGNDAQDGSTPEQALRTIDAAWRMIPMGETLTTGYNIRILPGTYSPQDAPNYWESRYGTYDYPVIIEAANGPDTVYLPSINMVDSRYIYFINLNLEIGADAFHCERCDYLLLRGNTFVGADPETYNAQETIKVNQSQYVFVEDNDISGAWDNAVDFVAVQYGQFLNNRISNAGDWCMYLKGGSAYFYVAGNEFYNCGTGGFTAGQGTGFQFMSPPFIQYEAYDIKFVNNFIHDVQGAGMGVKGGYNILYAYNTLVRVGERSHVLEFTFGERSCDGQPGEEGRERCDQYREAGGWGNNAAADGTNFVRIPNRNVYVYNNVIYNPAGYRSGYQQFEIFGAFDGAEQANSGVPSPARTDDNLQIRGNIIWNGDETMPLGIDTACPAENPTCNPTQLTTDNAINTLDPLTNALQPITIPDFTWDVPVPQGNLSNTVGVAVSQPDLGEMLTMPPSEASEAPPDEGLEAAEPEAVLVPTVPFTPAAPPVGLTPLPAGSLTIVALGDSLTEGAEDDAGLGGYPARLLKMVETSRPGSTVLNLGQSGWNSDALINGDQGLPEQLTQAEEAIRTAVARGEPAVALVWIGSNDLFYLYEYNNPDAAAEQADLENYSRNLDTILGRLTGAGAQVIIALLDDQSLRPVVTRGEAFPGTSTSEVARMSEQVKRYNSVITEKAAQYGALVVDFYTTILFTSSATLADDGNHPNAAGYDIVASLWFGVLKAILS